VGIPAVRRSHDYLLQTVSSLFAGIPRQDRPEVEVVVLNAERPPRATRRWPRYASACGSQVSPGARASPLASDACLAPPLRGVAVAGARPLSRCGSSPRRPSTSSVTAIRTSTFRHLTQLPAGRRPLIPLGELVHALAVSHSGFSTCASFRAYSAPPLNAACPFDASRARMSTGGRRVGRRRARGRLGGHCHGHRPGRRFRRRRDRPLRSRRWCRPPARRSRCVRGACEQETGIGRLWLRAGRVPAGCWPDRRVRPFVGIVSRRRRRGALPFPVCPARRAVLTRPGHRCGNHDRGHGLGHGLADGRLLDGAAADGGAPADWWSASRRSPTVGPTIRPTASAIGAATCPRSTWTAAPTIDAAHGPAEPRVVRLTAGSRLRQPRDASRGGAQSLLPCCLRLRHDPVRAVSRAAPRAPSA
jgi:hypothetical protein